MGLPKPRSVLQALGPSLALVLLVAVGGELWLRARHGRIERITGATEWETDSWQGLTYFWDRYHPLLGWTNRPGYRSDSRVPFEIAINAQGLRSERDYAERPPPGVERVALFGDSCAFGEEVDDDGTVSFHLERLRAGSEVLNFGVRGYGLGQMALRLEEEGFALHPDRVILLLLLPSDVTRDASDHFGHSKPVFAVRDGELQIGNVPVPIASGQPWLLRRSFAAAWLWGRPREWPAPLDLGGYLEISHAILRRVRDAAASRGIEATLALIVTPGTLEALRTDVGERLRIGAMRQSLAGGALEVVDLVPMLAEAYRHEGRVLAAPRGHWSSRGNQRIAEALAAHAWRGP
jgi:hypothetical protein